MVRNKILNYVIMCNYARFLLYEIGLSGDKYVNFSSNEWNKIKHVRKLNKEMITASYMRCKGVTKRFRLVLNAGNLDWLF